jgi:hypothetical protein
MKRTLIALSALTLAVTAANATTKSFEYLASGSPVATGSFSYTTGDTGVLGYGDLTAFSVTISGDTYDLAEVLPLTDYVWFAYDTASNSFVTNTNTCGFSGCGFASSLSAINSSGTYGFFFNPAPGSYMDYQTGVTGSFDSIVISNSVPEPSTWAMMLVGFAGLGFASYRTSRKAASIAA